MGTTGERTRKRQHTEQYSKNHCIIITITDKQYKHQINMQSKYEEVTAWEARLCIQKDVLTFYFEVLSYVFDTTWDFTFLFPYWTINFSLTICITVQLCLPLQTEQKSVPYLVSSCSMLLIHKYTDKPSCISPQIQLTRGHRFVHREYSSQINPSLKKFLAVHYDNTSIYDGHVHMHNIHTSHSQTSSILHALRTNSTTYVLQFIFFFFFFHHQV